MPSPPGRTFQIDIDLSPQDKIVSVQAVGALTLHPLDLGAPQAGAMAPTADCGDFVLKPETSSERGRSDRPRPARRSMPRSSGR